MSARVLYKDEKAVRPTCIFLLFGFACCWFALVGYGLLFKKEPWSFEYVIGTLLFVGVAGLLVVTIVKDGSWYIEINQDAILWRGPIDEVRKIIHADVEAFEVLADGSTRRMRVILKNGETVRLPSFGNARVIHNALLGIWEYRGYVGRNTRPIREANIAGDQAVPQSSIDLGAPLQLVSSIFALCKCGRLWVHARLTGVPITLRQIWSMRLQKINVVEVVRALCEAKAAGLSLSTDEIWRADAMGVDPQKLLLAMIEARRQGRDLTFQESLDAASR